MNYTTQYYKNLCENLQLEIMLLEAGLKKALKSGNPRLMKKELAKRRERSERLKSEAGRLNKLPKNRGALAADTKFAQAEALKQGIEDLTMPLEAGGFRTGVKLSELPSEKPWTDGPLPTDPQRPYPSPSEMAAYKLRTGKAFNQYYS